MYFDAFQRWIREYWKTDENKRDSRILRNLAIEVLFLIKNKYNTYKKSILRI